jgi:hypothetical protein
MEENGLQKYIIQACSNRSFGPEILHGLIKKESGYDEDAVSQQGTRGLCQLTKVTILELIDKYNLPLTVEQAFEPQNQILLASLRLEDMIHALSSRYPKLNRVKHLELALHAYNSGYSAVTKAVTEGGIKNYRKFLPVYADKHYAKSVMVLSTDWVPVSTYETMKSSGLETQIFPFLIMLLLVAYSLKYYRMGIKYVTRNKSCRRCYNPHPSNEERVPA